MSGLLFALLPYIQPLARKLHRGTLRLRGGEEFYYSLPFSPNLLAQIGYLRAEPALPLQNYCRSVFSGPFNPAISQAINTGVKQRNSPIGIAATLQNASITGG